MKNAGKVFGLIALMAVLGFAIVACNSPVDSITNQTPAAEDYIIDNLNQMVSSVTAVTITPKANKSNGAVTIWYEGSQKIPWTVGTYVVTFDVEAAKGWNAVSGLYAGRLTINETDTGDADTPVTNVEISITVPVKGATPDTTATTTNIGYTLGEVIWSPDDNPFKGGVAYTAAVMLTASEGYTLTGLENASLDGEYMTMRDNNGTTVTLTYTFEETDTRDATNMTIKAQPDNRTYTHGDQLDLAGLVVTLIYDDTTMEDVAAASFISKGITAKPANGDHLNRAMHHNQPVVIKHGELTVSTDNLIVSAKDIASVTIDPIAAQEFTGVPLTPVVVVKDGSLALTRDSDYTVAYNNNTNAGIATVTINGTGNYTGSTGSTTFTINPKVITFAVDSIAAVTYTGNPVQPAVTVKDGDSILILDIDYTVAYNNNTDAGTAMVTISGKGNYAGSTGSGTFTINPQAITRAEFTIIAPTKGTPPSATAHTEAEHFTLGPVSWDPNDNPFLGEKVYTATVTLTVKANYTFAGLDSVHLNGKDQAEITNNGAAITVSHTFPATLAKTVQSMAIQSQDFLKTYTYNDQLNLNGLVVRLTYDDTSFDDVPAASFETFGIETEPENGDHLYVADSKPVTIEFGSLTPLTTTNLTVNPKSITLAAVDPIPAQTYNGSARTPTVTVTDGVLPTLILGTDYTVTYTNNTNAGTATVTISGKGNYTGSRGENFTILQTVSPNRFVYYWVDQHDNLTTSGSEITVNKGEPLTITAQGGGYTVKRWIVNGVTTGEINDTYTFSSIFAGKHIVGLFVEKNGKLYNTNIIITVRN